MATTRQFCRQRLALPSKFDRRSFRTETLPRGHRLVVGCPKGRWQAKAKRCSVGTRAQSLLHPLSEGKCPPGKFEMRKKRNGAEGLGLHLPGEAVIMVHGSGVNKAELVWRDKDQILHQRPFRTPKDAKAWARELRLRIEATLVC